MLTFTVSTFFWKLLNSGGQWRLCSLPGLHSCCYLLYVLHTRLASTTHSPSHNFLPSLKTGTVRKSHWQKQDGRDEVESFTPLARVLFPLCFTDPSLFQTRIYCSFSSRHAFLLFFLLKTSLHFLSNVIFSSYTNTCTAPLCFCTARILFFLL